jgi:hypothetical protein
MPVLTNKKWEFFAQAVAEGMSGCAAYRQHVAATGTKTEACMANASRLLADANVALRVAELRASFHEVLEKKLGVRQETIARFLLSVIETPVEEVCENSALAQEVKRSRKVVGKGEDAEEWETEQVKTPSKLDAAKELNKMAGWYEPDEINVTMGYEPPNKALERLQGKGVDLAGILKQAGVTE